MEKVALVNARLVDPEAETLREETLLVEGGRLRDRLAPATAPGAAWRRVDLAGRLVAPGFIDLHFHGELFTAAPAAFGDALSRAARAMLRGGTTAFLATTLAWSREALGPRVAALTDAVAGLGGDGAACLGLHLEGPWINGEAAGAMSVECIRPFDGARDPAVLDRAGALLRMVTLAPEIEGGDSLLKELERRGVLAAIGHTRASEGEIADGVRRGVRHATHLFNAMGPVHHRAPGVAGTLLTQDEVTCDLICDGHHVHPRMVRIAARALRERLVLISDRVELPGDAGSADDAPARLADGTIAGSRLTLGRAIRNVRSFAGLDIAEAVAAASLRPARLLGIEGERGTLRPGARADLAVLDGEGRVVETWMEGARVWSAGGAAPEAG